MDKIQTIYESLKILLNNVLDVKLEKDVETGSKMVVIRELNRRKADK